ncbi:MAG TPA: hypothetical protein VGJ61_08560, partial [Solirubrobacterales bacterium]
MSDENVELVRQFLNASIEVDEGLADTSRLHEFFVPDAPIAIDAFTEGGELHGIDEFLELRAT